MISENEIQAIKDRIDIVDLVHRHLPLKRSGGNYFACCPFHGESTPSFSVNARKGFYHCFGCQAHGDQIDWLVNFLGMPWNEAVARLAQDAGIQLTNNEDQQRIEAKSKVASVLQRVARWMHQRYQENRNAVEYVAAKRKLTEGTCSDFLLGYAPRVLEDYLRKFPDVGEQEILVQAGVLARAEGGRLYPKLGGRLIFPLRDAAGWVIGFSGRVILDEIKPKYMNSPDSPFFSKRNEIFRAPNTRHAARQAGRLVVTEGYFDVMVLHQAGIEYVVAGMGTAITPENLQSMFSLSSQVVFCLDGDKAGRAAAWRALLTAVPVVGDSRLVTFAFLPDGLDPDEFINQRGAEAFQQLIDGAVPLSRFFLDTYQAQMQNEPLERHSGLLSQAAKQVAMAQDDVLRNGLAAELAKVFGATVGAVRKAGGIASAGSGARARGGDSVPVLNVQPNALEMNYLAALLRNPWHAWGSLAPGVEIKTPGGLEIVATLQAEGILEDADRAGVDELVRGAFAGLPFEPLVQQLLELDASHEDVLVLGQRMELEWITRRLQECIAMPFDDAIRDEFRRLTTRRFDILKGLGSQ